jgi:hypothetical protein
MFIDLIAWIHSICINSVEFSNIFDILKINDVILWVCPLIDHGSRPMKSHEFLRLLYNIRYVRLLRSNQRCKTGIIAWWV